MTPSGAQHIDEVVLCVCMTTVQAKLHSSLHSLSIGFDSAGHGGRALRICRGWLMHQTLTRRCAVWRCSVVCMLMAEHSRH